MQLHRAFPGDVAEQHGAEEITALATLRFYGKVSNTKVFGTLLFSGPAVWVFPAPVEPPALPQTPGSSTPNLYCEVLRVGSHVKMGRLWKIVSLESNGIEKAFVFQFRA